MSLGKIMADQFTIMKQESFSDRASSDSDASWLTALRHLWPDLQLTDSDIRNGCYNGFRTYVEKQVRALSNHRADFAIPNLEHTINLVSKLQTYCSLPKEGLVGEFERDYPDAPDFGIERSVELAVRIWLTLSIQSPSIAIGRIDASVIGIEWTDISLQEVVGNQFSESQTKIPDGRTRLQLDPRLTVAYLIDNCNLHVKWTNNLADHLQLVRKTRTLKIYQHKICLLNHLNQAVASDSEPVIPTAVLKEAIDTLNLLFPIRDSATKAFLAQENKSFNSLGNCGRASAAAVGQYNYWRDELLDLVDLLNEPAESWKQLLWRRRTIVESATFWNLCIAVVVVLLTVFNIIFGTVQTVYTVKSYKLAAIQFCANPGNGKLAPGVC